MTNSYLLKKSDYYKIEKEWDTIDNSPSGIHTPDELEVYESKNGLITTDSYFRNFGKRNTRDFVKIYFKSDLNLGLTQNDFEKYLKEHNIKTIDESYESIMNPDLGSYHNYEEVLAELDQIQEKYPSLISVVPLTGSTTEGRDIMAVNISSSLDSNPHKKKILLVANQHARELITVEMALGFINDFAENQDTPRVKNILNECDIWIIPSLNPDGLEKVYLDARQRTNGSGVDINRSFPFKKQNRISKELKDKDSDTYMGPGAPTDFRSPEAKALAILQENIGFDYFLDIHSSGNVIIYPKDDSNSLPISYWKTLTTLQSNTQFSEQYNFGTSTSLFSYEVAGDAKNYFVSQGAVALAAEIYDRRYQTHNCYNMYCPVDVLSFFNPLPEKIEEEVSLNLEMIYNFIESSMDSNSTVTELLELTTK